MIGLRCNPSPATCYGRRGPHGDGTLDARTEVYYNRTRRLWSVRHAGKVISHVDRFAMTDCRMKVSEKSRQRFLRTGKRTVHAWIAGTEATYTLYTRPMVALRYNPLISGDFRTCGGIVVRTARMVIFQAGGRCYVDARLAQSSDN